MGGFHGTVRLDERGRLVLPAVLRHRLGMVPGAELLISEDADGSLHIASRHGAARALIGIAGDSDRSAVDELLALRRADTVGEDADAERSSR